MVPTIFVAATVSVMVGLGFWQLQRKGEKEALLARYEAALEMPPIAYPATPDPELFFRRANGFCLEVVDWRALGGRSLAGRTGWIHIASCRTGGGEGPGMQVVAGWSESPEFPGEWDGGEVEGVITLDPEYEIRLVSSEPLAGLQAAAPPDPANVPNNHLAYAIQWFLFALTAAIVYILAVRRRTIS